MDLKAYKIISMLFYQR